MLFLKKYIVSKSMNILLSFTAIIITFLIKPASFPCVIAMNYHFSNVAINFENLMILGPSQTLIQNYFIRKKLPYRSWKEYSFQKS